MADGRDSGPRSGYVGNIAEDAGGSNMMPPLRGRIGKRIALGIGANVLGQGIRFMSHLFLVPLFLRAWGIKPFGQWQVLTAFAAYLALADLGGQQYIVNSMTKAYATGNLGRFRRVLHSGLTVYIVLPIAALALLALLVLNGFPEFLLKSKPGEIGRLDAVALLLGLQIVLSLPQGILLGVFKAVGMLPRAVMFANVTTLLSFFLVAGGLLMGFQMMGIALLGNVPLMLMSMVTLIEIRARFPQFGLPFIRDASAREIMAMVRPSLDFFLIQIARMITLQGPILIVGTLMSAAYVVTLSTLQTMVSAMRHIMLLCIQSSWPEIIRLDTQGSSRKYQELWGLIVRMVLVLGGAFGIALLLFGGPAYRIWLGGAVEFSGGVLGFLILYGFQFVFWGMAASYLMAVNRHHRLSRVMLTSALLGILFGWFGARLFGLKGLVAGVGAGELALATWAVPLLFANYRKEFSVGFHLRELFPPALALGAVFVSRYLAVLALPFLALWLYVRIPKNLLPWKKRS